METKELEQKYADFLKDSEFQKLEIHKKTSNIFDVLGIASYEIRHSNFLAWLFDPIGNHGLSSIFLKRFLSDISLDERCKNLSIIDVQNLNFNNVKIYREWNNIDILITIDDLVFCIENKIYHFESLGQLKEYISIVESVFSSYKINFVYLTLDGDFSTENNTFINYSYEPLVKYLEQILLLNNSINLKTKELPNLP
jgi:PD-(D/E)XK nuclease superfamily